MKCSQIHSRARCLAFATGSAIAASLGFAHTASASPITIANPGFEDPLLNDGAFQSGVPGWTAFNGGSIGVLHPSSGDLTAGAPEGDNVAIVSSSTSVDGLSQMLSATFKAGSSYTLTTKVANTLFTSGFPGYGVQLVVDGTVIAEDDNSQTVALDSVVTSTVNYTYDAGLHSGLVGQPLEIRLLSKGLASGNEVAFDDVQLTFLLLDPAADPGGPYVVAINGSLELDGSGSMPSDGQALTLYEWDLNDDGTFDEGITGATPSAISYEDLQTLYGMAVGPNPIRLRVTDDSSPTPKTSITSGTVTLAAPIGCQLGVLDLDANGGINPNTGNPWQLGDTYRIAFHTLGTTQTTFNDPNYYNDFATSEAWEVPALQGTYWRAMVTVNLDSTTTQELSPKSHVRDNTGTDDVTGGAGVGGAGGPVYVMDGSTCIARNNADIWNGWSNPFDGNATIRIDTGNLNSSPHYSPFLDQFGNQSVNPDAIHGKDVAAGCNLDGSPNNPLGDTTDSTRISRGNSNANRVSRVWNRFGDDTTTARSVYAISVPLTIVDVSETIAPELLSFDDDRDGADATLGVDTVVYTVTFSEPMRAGSISAADFENAGSASVTIDAIRGTLDPAAFEVIVTPTSLGTVQLQVNSGAVIEDPVGNPLDTSSPITDTTTITVVEDTTPPTLVSIEDNISGGTIVAFNSITYTVTFDKAIDASTMDIADFGNGGTAPIIVDSVSPTGDPAVYTVVVTPTGAGELILEIVENATITDLVGNALDTTAALPDDTTITVEPDPIPTLVSIIDNQGGGPVFAGQSFTYFVTFDQAIDPTSIDVTDFENADSPAISVNAIATTSAPEVFAVHVTPGGAGTITLQVAAGAVITNLNGTELVTTSAIPDTTTLTVNPGSGPARGTITLDGTASWNASSGTLNGTLDASGSDKLVVIVTGEHGNPGSLDGDVTSVTYDGVALTEVVDRNPIGGSPVDQTYNSIWYLDNPGAVHAAGAISATVSTRGSVTAFALSGTAPGAGQTAISAQASKSVVLSTTFENSIVIASHGMGGDGNTANVGAVDAVSPLIEVSALFNGNNWDGQVSAYALTTTPGTATYAFTGGNLVGSHTIAAEFLAAEDTGGGTDPYDDWAAINAPTGGPDDDFDGDGVPNAIEFVLGGSKDTNDLDKLPAVATSGGDMTFTFVRDQASIDASVAVSIEVGSDLATWPDEHPVPDTATAGPPVAVVDNGDGTDTITLTVTQAPDVKKFARLKVVITP